MYPLKLDCLLILIVEDQNYDLNHHIIIFIYQYYYYTTCLLHLDGRTSVVAYGHDVQLVSGLCVYSKFFQPKVMSLLQQLEELIIYFDIKRISINRKTPYEIYKHLGCPKYILAPMVLQSELPFRIMCKKYGTMLSYTPMITSSELIKDYQMYGKIGIDKHLLTHLDDRPLVVQLCASNVDQLMNAAKIIENNILCDAIDLNLGCPQERAQREGFGAFLSNKPMIVSKMIKSLVDNCKLPIFAKIRLLSTFDQSLKFVKMLETSGCSLIAIHGRQINQKNNGSADLEMIKKIKEKCPNIPIISNGNIRNFQDVENVLKFTKCDGVMSATAIRMNPYLFSNKKHDIHPIDICWEYLQFVEKYGVIDNESISKHILYFLKQFVMDFDYQHSLKCEKKKRQIGQIRKLLRWPKLVKHLIQYKSILDLLEQKIIIPSDKTKSFKNPNVKIFTIQQIKKQPGYIKYWHKHSKSKNQQ